MDGIFFPKGNNIFLIVLFFINCIFKFASAATLPYVLLDPDNLMFDVNLCPNGRNIEVSSGDSLPIVCGNRKLKGKLHDGKSAEDFSFHLYVTTNRTAFNKKDASSAHRLIDCKEESVSREDGSNQYLLKDYLALFSGSSKIFGSGVSQFYFFIASDDTETSSSNKPPTPYSDKLWLDVRICNDNICTRRAEQIGDYCGGGGSTAPQSSPSGKDKNDVMTSPAIFITFFLGIGIGIIVCIIGFHLHKRCEKEQQIEHGVTDDKKTTVTASDKFLLDSPNTIHLDIETTKEGDQCSV